MEPIASFTENVEVTEQVTKAYLCVWFADLLTDSGVQHIWFNQSKYISMAKKKLQIYNNHPAMSSPMLTSVLLRWAAIIWETSKPPQGLWFHSISPSSSHDSARAAYWPLHVCAHKCKVAHTCEHSDYFSIRKAQSVLHSGHGECHCRPDSSLERAFKCTCAHTHTQSTDDWFDYWDH